MEEISAKLKKAWQWVLILEEVLVIFILISFIYSLVSYQNNTDEIYFKISFQHLIEKPWYIFIFIALSFVILFFRSLILQGSFKKFRQYYSIFDSLKLLLQMDLRRAFSPIGLLSYISFFDPERNPIKGSKAFLYNQFLITIGDLTFYTIFFLFFWQSLIPILIFLIIFLPLFLFWQPKRLDIRNWLIASVAKTPKLVLFLLVFQAFGLSFSVRSLFYVFVAWDFSSAITPIFYGTGVSELIATIVAFFINIPFQSILVPIFVVRLFATYFPLILILLFRNRLKT